MNKKNKILTSIVLTLVLILPFFIAGCGGGNDILLKDGIILQEDKCSKLGNVTVIHAAGCRYCAIALPRLRELEQELNMSFDYYDMAIDRDKEEILGVGIIPKSVPIVIANCKVYVGLRTKDEYRDAILG